MLIKDLQEIKNTSNRNESKNWKFRSFLKMKDVDQIDRIVKPIYESIVAKINCLECGNCCRQLQPLLTKSDINGIGNKLNLSPQVTQEKFAEIDEFGEARLRGIPCAFLYGNECQIYNVRPNDCKSFPHIHKNGFTTRLIGAIENASICPIVFNVLEVLKYKSKFK